MTKPASLIPNSASSHQHHVEATSPANVAYYQQHSSSSFSRSNEAQESNHQVYQASSTTHVGSSGDFSSNAHTNQLVVFPAEPRPGAPPTMPSVSRACSNCKKSHLGCDFARPCKRCVSSGKQDSCMDVPKKIRERKVKPKAEAIREMMRIHEAEQQQQLTMKEKLESSQIVRSAASKACSRCRKSHLRCDNYRPCQRCIVTGRSDYCCDDDQGNDTADEADVRRWRSSSSGRKRHYSFDSLEPPAGSPHQIIYASSTSSPSHQHHHHHHRNQSDYNIPTDYDHHQRQQIIPSGSSQMAPVSAAPSYNSPTPSPASLLSSSSSSSRPAGDHHHYHHDTNIIPYLPQSSAGGSRHTYSNFTPAAALNSAARGHRRTLSSPAVPAIFPPPSTTSPSSPLLTYKFTDPAAATNTSAKYYSASNSPHASSNTKTHLALQIQPSFSYKIPDECTTTAAPYSSVDQKKEADIHQHSLPAVSYKRLRSENPASSPEQVPSIHLPAVLQLHQQLENQSTASLASESTATTPSSGVGSSFNGHQRNLSWNGSDDVFNNNGTHVIGHPVAPAIKRPSGFSIRDLLG